MTSLGRSVGRPALPVLCALVIGNYFLRPLDSLHELDWAVYNYHFVTVLLGPLVAGLGAWEGVRYATSREALIARGAEGQAFRAAWAALLAWVLLAYLIGLTSVIVAVWVFGTPGGPGLLTLQTTLPAITLVGLASAIGLYLGWRTGQWVLIAVAPVLTFGLIILGYSADSTLVRVGGAGASLVSIAPRPEVSATQTVLYLSATAAVLVLPSAQSVLRRLVLAAALGLIVASGSLLASSDGIFESRSVLLRCEGLAPPACLVPEYERYREALETAVGPLVDAIAEAGFPTPVRITQDVADAGPLIGLIPQLRDIDDRPGLVAAGAVTNAYVLGCLASGPEDPEQLEVISSVAVWVTRMYEFAHGERGERPQLPEEAIVQLMACRS